MSLTQHLTKIVGYAYEATEGTSPITSGAVPYYELGKTTKSRGNFPAKEYNIHTYFAGARDPNLKITHASPRGALAFAPTNGVEFYNIFGSSSTSVGVHTITGINTGTLPTRTFRFQSENATENIRQELLGAKTKSLNFQIFNANTRMRIPAMMGVGLQGVDVASAAYAADYSPVFPDSKESMYYVDSNFVFTWDFGTDNVDYSSELVDFQYICDTTSLLQPLTGQLLPNTVLDGDRAHILTFKILRGGDTSIYDDFTAQTRSSTGKSLRVKIFNDVSNDYYIQLDFSNVLLDKTLLNDGDDSQSEDDFYTVSGFAGSCTPAIKDGLTASTFYGE